jgi:hypothetical protein
VQRLWFENPRVVTGLQIESTNTEPIPTPPIMRRRFAFQHSLQVSRRRTGLPEPYFIEDEDWSQLTALSIFLTLKFVPDADRMVCGFRQAAVVEAMSWGIGLCHIGN